MRNRNSSNNKFGGFSLIEVVFAVIIISVGLLGLAYIQNIGNKSNKTLKNQAAAVFLANDMASRIAANLSEAVQGTSSVYAMKLDINQLNASYKCDNPGAACTPGQLAERDLLDWLTKVKETLPGGNVNITAAPDNNVPDHVLYTVTVNWVQDDGTTSSVVQKVSIEKPKAVQEVCLEEKVTPPLENAFIIYGAKHTQEYTWHNSVQGDAPPQACPQHMVGNVTRKCVADPANPHKSKWQDMNISNCKSLCPDNDVQIFGGKTYTWQAVVEGSYGLHVSPSADCPPGYFGTGVKRYCQTGGFEKSGVWQAQDNSGCSLAQCINDGAGGMTWANTPIGQNGTATCLAPATGTATRACNQDPVTGGAVWAPTWTGCNTGGGQCINDGAGGMTWSSANVGDNGTAACVAPETGTAVRACNAGPNWAPTWTGCNTGGGQCIDDGAGGMTWSSANVGENGTAACLLPSIGTAVRVCNAGPNWAPTWSGCKCQASSVDIGCPNKVNMLEGTQGQSRTVACSEQCSGYSGSVQIMCVNGRWNANSLCSALPTGSTCPAQTFTLTAEQLGCTSTKGYDFAITGDNNIIGTQNSFSCSEMCNPIHTYDGFVTFKCDYCGYNTPCWKEVFEPWKVVRCTPQ